MKMNKGVTVCQILSSYVAEHAPDYVADWNNQWQIKYSVYYSHAIKDWIIDTNNNAQHPEVVYMPVEIAAKLQKDLKKGVVKLCIE